MLLGESLKQISVPTYRPCIISPFSAAISFLLALFAAGCSGGAHSTTLPPPSFSLSLSSASLSVQQGGQGTVTITINPANGFSGTVSLSASGLPNNVTATFTPATATATSTLTLNAASNASQGSATITITGTASGLSATANLNLTIAATSFSLSSRSASVSLLQGGAQSLTITVVPANGFSGSVSLSAAGLPAGVTASFNPQSTTTSSTLTLTASSTAALGAVNVTVTGTSGGLNATTTISLTVGGFSLSVSPSSLAVQQISVANTTVSVNETSFSGTVTLSASGLPSGVTASFSPANTTTQSNLMITVTASAASGTSSIAINGTSGGVTETTTLTLTVRSAAPPGSIPASFFALSNVDPTDDPTADGMSYGAVGHPPYLAWPYIEPTQGTDDFTRFDPYVAIAPKEGPGGVVAVMELTLGMTPQWATSDPSTCRTLPGGVVGCQAPPPPGQPYWQDFITKLAQHYDGSSPLRPQIKYYEIWNEWNLQDPNNGYWMGTIPDLVTLQSQACSIIHATDPFSKVLTPSTVGPAASPNDQAPLDMAKYFSYGGSNCAGGPNNLVDGVAFHGIVASPTVSPYPLPGEGCTGTGCNGSIQAITNSYFTIVQQNFAPGTVPPLFNTEGGFETAGVTDIDQRAAWIAQFYILQAGLFNADHLQWVSWFTWGYATSPGVPGQIETSTHTPDAGGIAYNQVFDWLYAHSFSAPCSQTGTIWTCPVAGTSGYQAEITWDDSATCSNGTCTTTPQPAPAGAIQWRDLAGTVHQITGGQVPVGLKPIIVEN